MEVMMTTGAIRRAKLQSYRHRQHPAFYRPDALPVAQPAASEASTDSSTKNCQRCEQGFIEDFTSGGVSKNQGVPPLPLPSFPSPPLPFP